MASDRTTARWRMAPWALRLTVRLLVMSALIAGACRWGVPLLGWAEHHPNFAAWVQAIGSVAAIFVAIWVTDLGLRREVHARLRSYTALVGRSVALVEGLMKPLENYAADEALRVFNNVPEQEWATLERVMLSIPIHDVGCWDAVDAILDAQQALVRAHRSLDEIFRRLQRPPPELDLEALRSDLKILREAHRKLADLSRSLWRIL